MDWCAARPCLALEIFLIALPFAVFVIGCTLALHIWKGDADFRGAAVHALAAACSHFATLLIALATLSEGCVLAIVALHVIAD
ncbi:MAG TPA: hypothetical protein VLV88_14065 [Terriglobales bacterium]|nr:hypothetical protein [Terriglobales bacterium]